MEPSSSIPAMNGTGTAVSQDEESPSSKRKRDSEPRRKKKQQEDAGHVEINDEAALSESPTSDLDETKPDKEKKIRQPYTSDKNNQKVGFFLEEEVRKLEEHKVEFCNMNGLASNMSLFDAMVQHSKRDDEPFPCPVDVCTKPKFWAQIYELLPGRHRRSVYRFMRRHFQQSQQKAHEWTEEQDDELIELMEIHTNKWSHIAKLLGRSDDDVTQRWKNRLEHREKKNHGAWTEDELRELYGAVNAVWQMRKVEAPELAGNEIFDLEDRLVSWGPVSDAMNHSRSRQQCADKWRKIRRRIYELRATIDPNAEFSAAEFAQRSLRWSEKKSTPKTTPKSKSFVQDYDDGIDDDEGAIDSSDMQGDLKSGHMDFLNSRTSPGAETAIPESSQPEPWSQSQSKPVGANGFSDPVQASSSKKSKGSKKRNHSETEPPADDAESPSIMETPTGKKDKSEKKRLKREQREREQREQEEAKKAQSKKSRKEKKSETHRSSAVGFGEDAAFITPSRTSKSKNETRPFSPNGMGSEVETPATSQSKKAQKSHMKGSNGADRDRAMTTQSASDDDSDSDSGNSSNFVIKMEGIESE